MPLDPPIPFLEIYPEGILIHVEIDVNIYKYLPPHSF